jgi:hypothetical protein
MSANEIILWVLVAAVAFLVGQGRITLRGAPATVDAQPDEPLGAWNREDADLVRIYRRHTLVRLTKCYNLDELRTLAFDIGLKHDQISGDTPNVYAMELLEYCERRGMLQYLLAGMR